MIRFDRVLLDPSDEQLLAVLREAIAAVNTGGNSPRIYWPPTRSREALELYQTTPTGWFRRLGSDPPAEQARALLLAWWTDHLGRRHVRILGRDGNTTVPLVLIDMVEVSPLVQIAPEAAIAVYRDRWSDDVLVICPCGVSGTTKELAWMGTECGLCHDRRVADLPPPPPSALPALELTVPDPIQGMRFLSPSRLLIDSGMFSVWDLDTGRHLPVKGLPTSGILGWSPDAAYLALDGHDRFGPGVHIVQTGSMAPLRSLTGMRPLQAVEFSPSGRYALLIEDTTGFPTVHLWDWREETARPKRVPGRPYARAFAADEKTLYTAASLEAIDAIPLDTTGHLRQVPLGTDILPTTDTLGASSLHVCPDRKTLIAGYRRSFRVRELATGRETHRYECPDFIPLGAGWVLSPDGRILVRPEEGTAVLDFLALPNLTHFRRLLSLQWPRVTSFTANERWLVLADAARVRLVPWLPLLEWYAREVSR